MADVPAVIQAPRRPTMIRNLMPRLPERGKIKIGQKGAVITSRRGVEFQPPKKLDHFVVTTLQRGKDGNFLLDREFHDKYGETPTEIPVRLLYDDPELNAPSRYACYVGRTLWCSGDGVEATRLSDSPADLKDPTKIHAHQVSCPCNRQDPTYRGSDRCKMNGSLSVLIEGMGGVGGVWNFRTTSFNSITGLASSLAFLRAATGGILANIPLTLRLQPKQATSPLDQTPLTIYVVSLEFAGDVTELQALAHDIAMDRAKRHISIAHIEEEAKKALSDARVANAPLPGDDGNDVVEEFYPEQVPEPVAKPARPTREEFATVEGTDPEIAAGKAAALEGMEALARWWNAIGKEARWKLGAERLDEWKAIAEKIDYADPDAPPPEEPEEEGEVIPETTDEELQRIYDGEDSEVVPEPQQYEVISDVGEVIYEGYSDVDAGNMFLTALDTGLMRRGLDGLNAVWENNPALFNLLEARGLAEASRNLSGAYAQRRQRQEAKEQAEAEKAAKLAAEADAVAERAKAAQAKLAAEAAQLAAAEPEPEPEPELEAEPVPEEERADFWDDPATMWTVDFVLRASGRSVDWPLTRDRMMVFAQQARTMPEIEKYERDNLVRLRQFEDAKFPNYAAAVVTVISAVKERLTC